MCHTKYFIINCQLYWGVVGAPEPNDDVTETVITNKTFRMTGTNFFQICNSYKESQTVSHPRSYIMNDLKNVSYPYYSFHCTISNWIHSFNHRHIHLLHHNINQV